jgi:riboflavin synthase
MFTGIITGIGEVIARDGGRFTIRSSYDPASIALGASIAHDGCCLTVTSVSPSPRSSRGEGGGEGQPDAQNPASAPHPNPLPASAGRGDLGSIFTVDVSNETLAKTTLKHWQPGRAINLERALKAGDELGGHIVSGHVDGVARITDIRPDGDSRRFTIEVPAELARYIAGKGSVALDGTSLTVNETGPTTFGINLIPHTLTVTTWGRKKPGDEVNLEIDLFARYVARLMEHRS